MCGYRRDRRKVMRRTLKTLLLMLAVAITLMSGSLPDWDALMLKAGMVKVTDLCDSFVVDLRYAGTRNFVGKNMYGSFNGVYLHPDAAQSLVAAQKALKKIDANYSIIIYDAARPRSVQRTMWNAVKGTSDAQYVARPERGGCHNYGVAVDVGLAYAGKPVDMGSGFDDFTEKAHITAEETLVKQGKINREALKNRRLLRRVMTEAGYKTYRREWWHFERYRVKYARAHLKLLDF